MSPRPRFLHWHSRLSARAPHRNVAQKLLQRPTMTIKDLQHLRNCYLSGTHSVNGLASRLLNLAWVVLSNSEILWNLAISCIHAQCHINTFYNTCSCLSPQCYGASKLYCFVGVHFCAYRSWLTLMHVLHLSMPTVHLNAFRRRRWHECHCPSCLIKYAGNAGRRGLHAQGRHLHPSLERGSLNTLLVLRALEFFVLQLCTESKASMYHGVGQPNFGRKLGGDFMGFQVFFSSTIWC